MVKHVYNKIEIARYITPINGLSNNQLIHTVLVLARILLTNSLHCIHLIAPVGNNTVRTGIFHCENKMFSDDSSRWRALTIRDQSANGHFVYGVKSTGIYCRPNCSARLARRANINFYKSSSEAETAGFRPCKRCQPRLMQEIDTAGVAVEKACAILKEEVERGTQKEQWKEGEESLKLRDLAEKVGLTNSYFHKIFKQRTGMTPKKYLDSIFSPKGLNLVQTYLGEAISDTVDKEPNQAPTTYTEDTLASALEHLPKWNFESSESENMNASLYGNLATPNLATLTNSEALEMDQALVLEESSELNQPPASGPYDWSIFEDEVDNGKQNHTLIAPTNTMLNMDDLCFFMYSVDENMLDGDAVLWDEILNLN